jgi:hypothetical protein
VLIRTVVPAVLVTTSMASVSSRASQRPQPPAVDPVPVVGHLADQHVGLVPEPQPSAPATVPDRVGDQLVDREHEVVQPLTGEAGGMRAGGDRVSNLGHLGLVEGVGDQEGRFDGHNRTRCVWFCVGHGPVPAADLGVLRGFSTVRQGFPNRTRCSPAAGRVVAS